MARLVSARPDEMEDVSYMTEHGETETHVIFVDSSQRDTVAYPTPAEYRIPFDEPLRNVVGVDVLDSVVPSTMYVVDEHNRDVRMYFIATDRAVARHASFTPHLSSYLQWWLQLETAPELDAWSTTHENRTTSGFMDVIDTRLPEVDAVGAPIVPLTYPTLAAPLADEATFGDTLQRRLAVVDVNDTAAPVGGSPTAGQTVVLYQGRAYWVPAGYGFAATRSQLVTDAATGHVLMVTLAYAPAIQTGLRVACHRLQFPRGNYGTLKLLLAAGTNPGGTPGDVAAATPKGTPYLTAVSTDEDRLLQVKVNATLWAQDLQASGVALAAFDLTCGMSEVLGFTGSLTDPGVVQLATRAGQTAVKRYYTNQVADATPTDYLYPSGVVNMTGERYIILRCVEVEAGMFAQSVTGSRGTGIGLFKLPGPGALREQRQDYITVVKRPFHPIGRMDGLTLRMERGRAPGTLYNFKGVNHLLVMAVKVLVPRRDRAFPRSVLNPNYDRDFIAYSLAHRMRADGDPDPLTAGDVATAMRRHEYLLAAADADSAAAAGAGREAFGESDSCSDTDADSGDLSDGRYARA